MTWEHKVVSVYSRQSIADVEKELNELGRIGRELVAVTSAEDGDFRWAFQKKSKA